MAPEERASRQTLAYPRGVRVIAAVLGFISLQRLFAATGDLVAAISNGGGLPLALSLFFLAYFAALLATAVGLFWFKDWARYAGVTLLAVAIAITALLLLISIQARHGPNILLTAAYLAAAAASVYYLRRPHVIRWFQYHR